MAGEKRQRAEEVFSAALERELGERPAYVAHICGNDAELRHEVESLLGWARDGSLVGRSRLEALIATVQGEATELKAGDKVGRYEVLGKIGEGGMGEVYLARDPKLGRRVALKLLPVSSMLSQDRLRRFEQEAYAASNLNHPNIVTIYEIEQDGTTHFIAAEYVEGETLREHMSKRSVKLAEALDISIQVAAALAAAHQAEVVHRDIKPENVMLRPDGIIKVMDFGLAKLSRLLTDDHTDEKEATTLMVKTTPGVVMGTVGYMSPEQAQGKAVDLRSDIFSFGCILFELATGHKLFEGDSAIDSLHKTVHAPAPPIRDLNPGAPPELQRIVRRCLMKDPEERYQTIKDVAIELRELRREIDNEEQPRSTAASSPSGANIAQSGAQTRSAATTHEPQTESLSAVRPTSSAEYLVSEIKRHKRGLSIALAGLVLVLAGGSYGIYRLKVKASHPALSFQAAKLTRLTTNGKVKLAVISPDGRYMVDVMTDAGQESLWMMHLATQSNVQLVPPANAHYYGLTFSPEGNYIYFLKRNETLIRTLYQMPVLGGAMRKVWDDVDTPITFSPDGKRFAFVRIEGPVGETYLMIANTDGSGERKVATKKAPESFGYGGPAWSPDGRVIACGVQHPVPGKEAEPFELMAVSADDGTERQITSHRWRLIDQILWLPDGGGLLLSAADLSSGYFDQLWDVSRSSGEVQRITNDLNYYYGVSLTADSNALITVQSDLLSNLWVAAGGDANHARQITAGKYDGFLGIVAADNKIVFVTLNYDIWTADADGGSARLITPDEHNNRSVSVSPDSRYVVFESWRGGGYSDASASQIWRTDIDGGNPKRLTSGKGFDDSPTISPDGKWVIYVSDVSGKAALWKISIEGGEATQITDEFSFTPAISPDGKSIAYIHRVGLNDPFKVAIMPFGGGPPSKEFNLIPGANPFIAIRQMRWSPDGRTLQIIVSRGGVDNIWSQPLAGGQPVQLTSFKSDRIFAFDWSRDGKQLVLARGTVTPDAVLISNLK